MANARRRTQRTTRTGSRSAARSSTSAAMATALDEEARIGRTIDWQGEFQYISRDLKQLAIVTIILFILLFAAGFFL